MAIPFITATDLGDYLGITVTSDPGATIAIDAACDICRTEADLTFNKGTSTVTLDGSGGKTLRLPEYPVVSAGTVTVAGSADTAFLVDSDKGVLVRGTATPWNVWPEGYQNVTVTYVHGYADADIPRDLRMVALSVASRLVVQGPAQYETVGDVSVRYGTNATDLTDGERRILRKYKDRRRVD